MVAHQKSSNAPPTVTWKQVVAFRLARHHLLKRAPRDKLISVLRDMTGAQAQLLAAAQISLWTRVNDLQISDIEKSLNDRHLVKASCMRRTLFLVPSECLAVFVRGSARRAEREIRWALGKGVPQRTLDAVTEATLVVLDQPLTRPEIAEGVCRAMGLRVQAYHGGGWGNQRKLAAVPVGKLTYPVGDLLNLVSARGVVCYGVNRRNEPTFVRADAWIPNWQDLPRSQAEDDLLRMYLRAFGPATVTDFALWSGISLTDAREIWTRAVGELATIDVQGWTAMALQKDVDEIVSAQFERPLVRLLPYFDTFLLGHRERGHIVDLQHYSKVYRAQGWITPVVIVDGRVAAVWGHVKLKDRLRVKVTKLQPVPRFVATRIREEAQDLGRFFDITNVEVEIS